MRRGARAIATAAAPAPLASALPGGKNGGGRGAGQALCPPGAYSFATSWPYCWSSPSSQDRSMRSLSALETGKNRVAYGGRGDGIPPSSAPARKTRPRRAPPCKETGRPRRCRGRGRSRRAAAPDTLWCALPRPAAVRSRSRTAGSRRAWGVHGRRACALRRGWRARQDVCMHPDAARGRWRGVRIRAPQRVAKVERLAAV